MSLRVLVRGGGDLASGAILRCARAGWQVAVAELAQPLAVRRLVSFSQAIYDGEITIEGIRGVRVSDLASLTAAAGQGLVSVIVDPDCRVCAGWQPDVVVDGRMTKQPPGDPGPTARLSIGLGPGFEAGVNCDAVIETVRGPFLGRVIWKGPAEANTGIPDAVGAVREERVLRAPAEGTVVALRKIGDTLKSGEPIAEVNGEVVRSPFDGVLRGLVQAGVRVPQGVKIGDVDPRNDRRLCFLVSDKALAVGGGVLEAILSAKQLWERHG